MVGRGGMKSAALRAPGDRAREFDRARRPGDTVELLLAVATAGWTADFLCEAVLVAVLVGLVVLLPVLEKPMLAVGSGNVCFERRLFAGRCGGRWIGDRGLADPMLQLFLNGFVGTIAVHAFRVLLLPTLFLSATTCHLRDLYDCVDDAIGQGARQQRSGRECRNRVARFTVYQRRHVNLAVATILLRNRMFLQPTVPVRA
jgi:hypothetical protein